MASTFADRSIVYFKQFIKDGRLDAEAAMKIGGLNERQIPELTKLLLQAGFIETPIEREDEEDEVEPAE